MLYRMLDMSIRRHSQLFALAILIVPATISAKRPSFIPPPLKANDIPGERQSADITGQIDPNRPAGGRPPATPGIKAVTGVWTSADGELAVDSLVRNLVADGALARLSRRLGRQAVVRVLRPVAHTPERIETQPMASRAELLLRRSGEARVAATNGAADLALTGYLGSLPDRAGRLELRSYLFALSLIDVVTGEKLWVDVHRVRRLLRHRRTGAPKVQQLKHHRAIDLSGRFNDHDAATAASRLASNLTRSRWISSGAHHPVRVRLQPLRNRTSEVIDHRFVTLPFERALIRQPGIRVLASITELQQVRRQRALRRRGVQSPGAELGATFVLRGQLSANVERLPGQPGLQLRTYHLTLEAVAVADNTKVWIGNRSVKKVISTRQRW